MTVEGRDYVTREAILAALDVKAGDSLLGIDLQASRRRLEAIDWVASATVERRLPDALYVTLKERRAVAIWQNGQEYTLIDQNGRTVRASRMPPGADSLLLLGGAGAPEHVGDLLLLLTYEPAVARQLRAAVWVGQRRWNLILKKEVEIWLPEEDAVAALQRLVKLDRDLQAAVARIRRRRSQAAGQALSQEAQLDRRCIDAGGTRQGDRGGQTN